MRRIMLRWMMSITKAAKLMAALDCSRMLVKVAVIAWIWSLNKLFQLEAYTSRKREILRTKRAGGINSENLEQERTDFPRSRNRTNKPSSNSDKNRKEVEVEGWKW